MTCTIDQHRKHQATYDKHSNLLQYYTFGIKKPPEFNSYAHARTHMQSFTVMSMRQNAVSSH